MMVKNDGVAYVIDSICEGQTIHLGVQHRAMLVFESGEVWSYVSAWDDATMVLKNSLVDWKLGRFIYQTRNIAHGNSRLYCINSWLRSPPEALDAALVLFVAIDRLSVVTPGRLGIRGSAWIGTGSSSPASFERYRLEFSKEGDEDWSLIEDSVRPVDSDELGVWDIADLSAGRYTLRLTVWTRNDDWSKPTHAYPAVRTVTLPMMPPPRRTSRRLSENVQMRRVAPILTMTIRVNLEMTASFARNQVERYTNDFELGLFLRNPPVVDSACGQECHTLHRCIVENGCRASEF